MAGSCEHVNKTLGSVNVAGGGGVSCPAERPLASHERLFSMKLVTI